MDTVLNAGPITLNLADHSASVAGQLVNVTVTEFPIAALLGVERGNGWCPRPNC